MPSGTTLLGLVKHLTLVEAYWVAAALRRLDVGARSATASSLDPDDTVASVRRRLRRGGGAAPTRSSTACRDPERPLARGRHGLTLRWMLAHLIEETARHAGHADILRELLDGVTGR